MDNTILQMTNITKRFPGVKALDSVDFSVKRGEVRGLAGANGAGKSTLMKVLSGAHQMDSGSIVFDGTEMVNPDTRYCRDLGIAVIYQELSLVDSMSVAENIFLNNYHGKMPVSPIDWKGLEEKARVLLKDFALDINPSTLVKDLSIGHRQLVEIVKAIAIDAKLIVMDEPSATLSKEEFEALMQIIKVLKSKGITIIYITHRLEEFYMIGDSITVLRDGKHEFTGSLSTVPQAELVKLMIGHNVIPFMKKTQTKGQEVVLSLDNVSTNAIKNVSMEIKKSEIRGIYGLVGSGRTEVLRAIYGVDKLVEGKIIYKGAPVAFQHPHQAIKQGIGLLPENRKTQGLITIHPVWENATLVSLDKFLRRGVLQYRRIFRRVDEYTDKLAVKTPSIDAKINTLSGGNQQKVVIAKWLIKDCDLLLVDEPTQGIDVGAKAEIYAILEDLALKGKTIIVVSSELEELLAVSNNISVMYENRLVQTFTSDEFDATKIQECAITGRAL